MDEQSVKIEEKVITIPTHTDGGSLIGPRPGECGISSKAGRKFRFAMRSRNLMSVITPVRLALLPTPQPRLRVLASDLFGFRKRALETTDSFNAVLLVPTGIGAEIGGHAGDATAVARMMAESCDKLLLHPNVVNASDINELPDNALYTEGSIITRLLMGNTGLLPTRANRILVVLNDHPDKHFVHAAINSVSAGRGDVWPELP